jgi:hypothetical protein
MRDDHHPLTPSQNGPEDINFGRIQTDLEFLIERVSKLPTRGESAFESLIIIRCSAAGHRVDRACPPGLFVTPMQTSVTYLRLHDIGKDAYCGEA